MRRLLPLFVLAALALGLAIGAGLQTHGAPIAVSNAAQISALGGLWLDALRMTIVPLVFSLLVVSVASTASVARSGNLAARALILFSVLIFAAAAYAIIAINAALALWPIDADAAANFIAGIAGEPGPDIAAPTFAQFLRSLVPPNPIAAAAADSILQIVVFALFFGFAATTLPTKQRDLLTDFFRAISDVMIKIVHWVLLAGPIGVFALALGVGLSAGFGAAGMLVHYALVVSGITFGACLIACALAIIWGAIPPGRFFAGAAPVWAIAASSQSSLASLPAMLEAARESFRLPARVAEFVLPLAVAVFRFTSPVANLAVCFFIAALYGLEPSVAQIAAAILVAFVVSVSSVGLPGQVSFFTSIAPICMTLGVPLELLGVFIAVEIVPDIFRTLGNVTADLAGAAILSRREQNAQTVA